MVETKTWSGGCHCGRVRFEVETDLAQVMSCNCSICSKCGTLFAFVTPDRFKLTSGEGAQTVYHFNKGLIDHMFCPTCGIASFSAGKAPSCRAMVAVNVRCLDDIDLSQIAYGQLDGKSL